MPVRYELESLDTRFFTGTMDPRKLQDLLNARAAQGWCLSRTLKEQRRSFLGGAREAHYLIFERDTDAGK